MKNPFAKLNRKTLLVSALAAAVALVAIGCQTTGNTATTAPGNGDKRLAKSAAQVWADNCARCHNLRSPAEYSDYQWEAASLHMRMRAGLTAQEHKAILGFLKSAN